MLEARLERRPLDERHDVVDQAVAFADIEDRNDAGVAQLRERDALGPKPLNDLGDFEQVRLQDLDGHHAVQPLVLRAVHAGESALASERNVLVFAAEGLLQAVLERERRPGRWSVRSDARRDRIDERCLGIGAEVHGLTAVGAEWGEVRHDPKIRWTAADRQGGSFSVPWWRDLTC